MKDKTKNSRSNTKKEASYETSKIERDRASFGSQASGSKSAPLGNAAGYKPHYTMNKNLVTP